MKNTLPVLWDTMKIILRGTCIDVYIRNYEHQINSLKYIRVTKKQEQTKLKAVHRKIQKSGKK